MSHQTALHDLQALRGASFSEFQSWTVADHYGDPLEEYQAARRGAALFDLGCLGLVRVLGRDRVRFLHRMLSNDVEKLGAGSGCYATLLNPQGHMQSDLFCYRSDDDLWLVCPPAGTHRVLAALDRHIVGDKVELEDWTHRQTILSIQGPQAGTAVERLISLRAHVPGPLGHTAVTIGSVRGRLTRTDRTGLGGYELWLSAADAPQIWQLLVDAGRITPAGHRCLNWLRTEAGIPWYGEDMDERSLPVAFGLQSAISFTKGCYPGQEIIARITHRGHLDRSLAGIAFNHPEAPGRGAEVRAGDSTIGEVTSSVSSPFLGKPLALAVLRSRFLRPGSRVAVRWKGGELPGEVVALPLWGDSGPAGRRGGAESGGFCQPGGQPPAENPG